MRPGGVDASTIELLSMTSIKDVHNPHEDKLAKAGSDGCTSRLTNLLIVLLVLATIAPLAILAGLTPRLSTHLAYNACMPNGDFVLPFTTSIWNPSHFFTITLPFTGKTSSQCLNSPGIASSGIRTCVGYSFAAVKAMDIAFDVLVGRGLQALSVWIAYRLFRTVVASLMERGEVGYDVFASVAFNSGTLRSSATLFRHAVGRTPLPRSRRAMRTYAAMVRLMAKRPSYLRRVLIVLPFDMALDVCYGVHRSNADALLSYDRVHEADNFISNYVPYIQYPDVSYDASTGTYTVTYANNYTSDPLTATDSASNNRLLDCGGEFRPSWGARGGQWWANEAATPILYDYPPGSLGGPDWIDYYQRYYADVYSQCPVSTNISDCAAANISTYVLDCSHGPCYKSSLAAPLQGIIPWPDVEGPGNFSRWNCAGSIVDADQLLQYGGMNATGVCQAGSRYAWGFSFIVTFIVSVLNVVFALTMLGLWHDARHVSPSDRDHSEVKDAVTLVTQAQAQYGDQLEGWSAKTLQTQVVNGRQGMTLDPTRRRTGFSQYTGDVGDAESGVGRDTFDVHPK